MGVLYLKEDFLGPKLGRFPGISLQSSLDLGNLQSLLSILPFIKLFSFRYFLTVMEILVTQTSGKQYLLDQKKKDVSAYIQITDELVDSLINKLVAFFYTVRQPLKQTFLFRAVSPFRALLQSMKRKK